MVNVAERRRRWSCDEKGGLVRGERFYHPRGKSRNHRVRLSSFPLENGNSGPSGNKKVSVRSEEVHRKIPTRMSSGQPEPASWWQTMMRVNLSPLLKDA